VVSVDYPNAPEARFDAAIETDYSALLWIHRQARELAIDPARVAVMGESSGGGHAALLAITARDRGEAPICFQALTYPMLDDRTGSRRAMPPHLGAFGWTATANRFGWGCFLGQAPGTDAVPVSGAPSRVESVADLPPTFVSVGALDLFVDEDITFAQRLVEAAVPTELLVVPGAFHGFDLMAPGSALAARFAAARLDALRRAFA
jgi:acetyl esterase/lipase